MKRSIVFILLCAVIGIASQGYKQSNFSSYTMEVYRNGERVGVLQTSKSLNSEKSFYELKSDVEINKLVTVKISESLSNQYESGKLLSASHQRKVNGIHQSNVQLKYDNNKYVTHNGKVVEQAGTWIGASILSLYHKEPIGLEGVYSESHGVWLKVSRVGNGVYHVSLPNQQSAIYHYNKGELVKVVSATKWGEIIFKR
jgi:hypothetical protein